VTGLNGSGQSARGFQIAIEVFAAAASLRQRSQYPVARDGQILHAVAEGVVNRVGHGTDRGHLTRFADAERTRRGELTSDQCVIDHQHFFVRGPVEIPVLDDDNPFARA
jgi:hypothetical protein